MYVCLSYIVQNYSACVSATSVCLHTSSNQLCIALRDIADDLVHRKLRDVSDFEWQRFPRLQSHSELTVTEQRYLADEEEREGRRE